VLFASLLPNVARFVPPLDYLGDVSYGIYLWHLPVILALTAHSVASSAVTLLMWTLAIVIGLSALTWQLLERPIIRRFH
jgi:peptidoglycan/LPS O-acetylase OafA/YrhL